ncbi:MAG: BON domain-containing protein [Deltaproteobacteria bacterium]|nr:BON domain-containing protein [Deltaproteobacteria bacterium]
MDKKAAHASIPREGAGLHKALTKILLILSLILCLVLAVPETAGAMGAKETVASLTDPSSNVVSQDGLSLLNSLEHRKTLPSRDLDLARKIAQEIQDDPFIESNNIEITVVDGIAILTGTVKSWAEYAAATADALQCGAEEVKNRLQVMEETIIAGHKK